MHIPEDWLALWRDCGANGDGKLIFSELVKTYSTPDGRHYHTLNHVRECLSEFRAACELTEHPAELQFAIWYHDAIYDPRAMDNEQRSAELARSVALSNGMSAGFAELVHKLIMVTRHQGSPVSQDEKLIVDIDLSILGKAEAGFDRYETEIRQEYSWVEESQFRNGRSAILQAFLERPRIFSTPFFYEKYEVKARLNLVRSIAKLSF